MAHPQKPSFTDKGLAAHIVTKNVASGTRRGTGSTLESMAREPSNPSLSGEWGIICFEGAHLSSASITKFVKLLQGTERQSDNVILKRDSEIFWNTCECTSKKKKDFNLSNVSTIQLYNTLYKQHFTNNNRINVKINLNKKQNLEFKILFD